MLIGILIAFLAIVGIFALSFSNAAVADETAVASLTTLIEDDFESGISGTATDLNGGTNGEYFWATTNYTASVGTSSAWVTGGGANGSSLTAGTDNYPPNAESALTYGPVDLSSFTIAQLSYDYWTQTEAATDLLQVRASTDGSTFNLLASYDGDSGGWQSNSINLESYLGESQLWIRFYFTSNSTQQDVGAFIDNVLLEAGDSQLIYMPIIRLDPTPTPLPIPPPGDFNDDFNDNSNNWLIRRQETDDDGYNNVINFEDGLLKVSVNNPDDYIILSPMAQSPDGDYQLEMVAKFVTGLNKHRYGFVFGADWNGVDECPNDNFTSCFTRYYWLEIQNRDNNGNPKLQYRLYRIDGHDSDGQPIRFAVSDWSDVNDASYDINGFVKWEMTVRGTTIEIDVNDTPEDIIQLPDNRYLENRFVGLLIRTRSSGLNTVHIDYFDLDEK